MDRDPLALPGDPDYQSGPDSDIEVLTEPAAKTEHVNSNTVLEVELVPADMTYVNKITGSGKRGRKKKEVDDSLTVIDTGEAQLKVQLIRPTKVHEEKESDSELNGKKRRGRPPLKTPGRPKKKQKRVENNFTSNPKSTHHSRSSRYEQLQEKKDEFLQQETARKAAHKAKYQKYLDRAKEKYRLKKATEEKPERILLPFQKKLQRKICMLAMKICHVDKTKTKEELVKEMALEWKADRDKFWENYKKRWKEVAFRSVKPMTEERAEFLRKRGEHYHQLKQEQTLMLNRVSTRNQNKRDLDSPGSSNMGYPGQSYDGFDYQDEPDVINYAEYFDDNDFHAEDESFNDFDNNDDDSFLLAMNNQGEPTDMFAQQDEVYENDLLEGYQTNLEDDDQIPTYYEEDDVEEGFHTQIHEDTDLMDQINGYS